MESVDGLTIFIVYEPSWLMVISTYADNCDMPSASRTRGFLFVIKILIFSVESSGREESAKGIFTTLFALECIVITLLNSSKELFIGLVLHRKGIY